MADDRLTPREIVAEVIEDLSPMDMADDVADKLVAELRRHGWMIVERALVERLAVEFLQARNVDAAGSK